MDTFLKIILIVATLQFTEPAHAGWNCRNLLQLFSLNRPSNVQKKWESLRGKGLLVDQYAVDGKGGLCGPTCAVNMLQATLGDLGLQPLENPSGLLKRITLADKRERDISEVMQELRDLYQEVSPNRQPNISAILVQGIQNKSALGIKTVSQITVEDMRPAMKKYKLILMATLDKDNVILSQHMNIVSQFSGNTVHLIEPAMPYIEIEAEERTGKPATLNDAEAPQFFYSGTAEMGPNKAFVPFGVITIDMRNYSG